MKIKQRNGSKPLVTKQLLCTLGTHIFSKIKNKWYCMLCALSWYVIVCMKWNRWDERFSFYYCVTEHNHHETLTQFILYLHWRNVTNSVNSYKPRTSNHKVTRHVEFRCVCLLLFIFFFCYSLFFFIVIVVLAAPWLLEFAMGMLLWIKINCSYDQFLFQSATYN